jgi:AraC-like DNA-binding protein
MCAFHSPVQKNGSNPASTNGTLPAAVDPDSNNAAGAKANGARLAARPVVQERRVLKILQMIESEEPLFRIHDVARQFNLSHSYLEHIFKEQTGVPLGQLLTEQRLRRAAYLLVHTNKRIKEIAQAVGYEHTSSFVRAFERHFTKPPRLYRQESPKLPSGMVRGSKSARLLRLVNGE